MVHLWSMQKNAGRSGKRLLPQKNLRYFLCDVQHQLSGQGSAGIGNQSEM